MCIYISLDMKLHVIILKKLKQHISFLIRHMFDWQVSSRNTGWAQSKGGEIGAGYVNLRGKRKRQQRRWDAKRKDPAQTVRN